MNQLYTFIIEPLPMSAYLVGGAVVGGGAGVGVGGGGSHALRLSDGGQYGYRPPAP